MNKLFAVLAGLGVGLAAVDAGAAEWILMTDFEYSSTAAAHVAPFDDTHVWATVEDHSVPPFGNIYFFDGADWTLQTAVFGAQTGDLKAICATASDDVWAVGETFEGGSVRHGIVFHYDGVSWELQTEVVSSGTYSQLEAVSAVDADEVWVGGTSIILLSTDGGATWNVNTDTTFAFWASLDAFDSTHVWAGGGSDPCTILLGDGTDWEVQTEIALGSSHYLRGLAALSETDVWAVGDMGYVFYYDGASWSVSTRVTDLNTVNSGPVAGLNENAVWAGPKDNAGGIYFFDGAAWSRQTKLGSFYPPEDLCISGRTVWAATENGRIYSYAVPTATPSPRPSPTPSPFYVVQNWTLSTEIVGDVVSALSAASDDDVWLPSTRTYTVSDGNIYHFDGSSWSLSTSAFTAETGMFRGVFALDTDHAWVSGELRSPSTQGRIYGWDGSGWGLQTQTFGVAYIYDVYAADDANIWASGSTGIILRSSDGGTTWARETVLGSYYVVSISGADVDNVWAVARWTNQSSRIYYSNAGNWTLDTIVAYEDSSRYLRDVCANTQTDVWAAGDGGLILHRGESGVWELSEDVGDTTTQAVVSAHDANNVWAGFGGSDAGVYYYDGTRWARVQGADNTCYGLDASAPSTVWAVTASYRVWKFDRPSPTPFGYETPTPTPSSTPTPPPTATPTAVPTVTPTPPWLIQGVAVYVGWKDGGDHWLRIEATVLPDPSTPRSASQSLWVDQTALATGVPFSLRVGDGSYYLASFWDTEDTGNWEPSACDPEVNGLGPVAVSGGNVFVGAIHLLDQCASPTPPPTTSPTPTAVPQTAAVAGDYDGDGTSDIAVYRPSIGLWAVRMLTRIYYGLATDDPVPADYDGDGTVDVAVFRPPAGKWLVRGGVAVYYGVSTDGPVPADYDGDGTADVAVWRPSLGKWMVRSLTAVYYGGSTDDPVPADYDGNASAEAAVYRSSLGKWLARGTTTFYYGSSADDPIPADYDGDGTVDGAIWRPSLGKWMARGVTSVFYGVSTDVPVPADFSGNGTADIGIFRPAKGKWLIKDASSVYFGAQSDLQVVY